jgi:hydrogenase maturation protease
MRGTLIVGYGNVDRMDDGVAWHVLRALARALGGPAAATLDDVIALPDDKADCQFMLQLTPELAETLAQYQRVCFVDAHTGDLPAETRLVALAPAFTNSPFTHHLTPETCLALAEALYGRAPQAVVASVRGEAFGFAQELSPATARRVPDLTAKSWLARRRARAGQRLRQLSQARPLGDRCPVGQNPIARSRLPRRAIWL